MTIVRDLPVAGGRLLELEQAALRVADAPAVETRWRRSPRGGLTTNAMDTAKDPGDVVRAGGAAAWQNAASAPVCASTWRALDLTGPIATSDNPLGRRAGLAHASAWLARLPARLAIEQTGALDTVSTTLGFDPDAVRRAFRDACWHRHREARPPFARTIER